MIRWSCLLRLGLELAVQAVMSKDVFPNSGEQPIVHVALVVEVVVRSTEWVWLLEQHQ